MGLGNIRLRNFAKLIHEDHQGNLSFSLSDLVEKLILFETIIIESHRLREIPILLNEIGFDQLMALLKSGVIQFHNDKITIGSKNQNLMHLIGHTEMKAFGIEPESLYKRNIQYIKENSDLSIKKFNQLENQLNAIVSKYPRDILGSLRDEFESDIKPNNQPLREAIRLKVKRELDIEIEPNDINVNTALVKNDIFKHESNLKELLNIDKNTEYHILDSALLSIGGLHEKILQMEFYNCLSGFKPDEISIFKAKLKFIEQVIDFDDTQKQFHRIIEIAGMPIINDEIVKEEVNFEQLLDIRKEDEIVSFRNWLHYTDQINDKELDKRINGFKTKLDTFLKTKYGKSAKFLVSTGLGAFEPISGTIFGTVETFLLDKFLKQPGAITFLSSQYPTIFKKSL